MNEETGDGGALTQLRLSVGDRIIVIDGLAGFKRDEGALGRRGTVTRINRMDVCARLDGDVSPGYYPPEFIRPLDAVKRLSELA